MTSYTETKLFRTFKEIPILNSKGEQKKDKNELPMTKNVRKDPQIPALENRKSPCWACGQPMVVADGQIARFHKSCRKDRHFILKHAKARA